MIEHYYNEFDEFACNWMASLADDGQIPAGKIDQRGIKDVTATDLAGFRQCHFFAGIGGWPLALRLAGWPEDREVWTGSCPCQPFSPAGKRKGTADERHLWPEFRRLIAQCRPAVVFGEQVAGKDGRTWLSSVRTDLEALGYAVGAADLCAAGIGAPHIRQRLFWVANRSCDRWAEGWSGDTENVRDKLNPSGEHVWLANSASPSRSEHERKPWRRSSSTENDSVDQRDHGRMEHTASDGRQQWRPEPDGRSIAGGCFDGGMADAGHEQQGRSAGSGEAETWRSFSEFTGCGGVQWLPCRDGKARPTVPGVRLLAHGFPNRVGLLRGFGNAIVPQVAAEFIAAFMEAANENNGQF